MNKHSLTTTLSSCCRQRPTHDPDEVEDLGVIEFLGFVELLRSIDWRHEAEQAEWAMKASPTLAVTNRGDDCTLWVSAILAKSFVDVDAEPDEQFRMDNRESWYSVGMKNPPEIGNVIALDPYGLGDDLGFTTAASDSVEECFKWFFEGDYHSLYELFRWV